MRELEMADVIIRSTVDKPRACRSSWGVTAAKHQLDVSTSWALLALLAFAAFTNSAHLHRDLAWEETWQDLVRSRIHKFSASTER